MNLIFEEIELEKENEKDKFVNFLNYYFILCDKVWYFEMFLNVLENF